MSQFFNAILARFAISIFSVLVCFSVQAQHSAEVFLDGDNYIQNGFIKNTSNLPGVFLEKFVLSTGTMEQGAAVFENWLSTGQHSNYLPGSTSHYTDEIYSGLTLGFNQTFTFFGLDIDMFDPQSVGGINHADIDNIGGSLRNASVSFFFSDGYSRSVELNETGWGVPQQLSFTEVSPVPEPATVILFAIGGLFLYVNRRKVKFSITD
jgi:hypothetical protein